MAVCITSTLLYGRNYHNVVNQLYFNKTLKKDNFLTYHLKSFHPSSVPTQALGRLCCGPQFIEVLVSQNLLCELLAYRGNHQKTENDICLKFMHFTTTTSGSVRAEKWTHSLEWESFKNPDFVLLATTYTVLGNVCHTVIAQNYFFSNLLMEKIDGDV